MVQGKKLSTQEVLAILLGAVLLAGMIYLIKAEAGAYLTARSNLQTEQSNLHQANQRLVELIKLGKKADLMQDDITVCDKLLPAAPQEDRLITDIQGMADQADTDFTQIQFAHRVVKSGYTKMPVTITFTGRNQGLLYLLSSLQDWPRAIRIDNVKVDVMNDQDQPDKVQAVVSASAFFRSSAQTAVQQQNSTTGGAS